MSDTDQTGRRTFLSRLGVGAAAAGLAVGASAAKAAPRQSPRFRPRRHAEDAWMDAPVAAHRVVIDSATAPAGGAALMYANTYFDANKSGYGLGAPDVATIVVLRHLSTPIAYNDAIWAKYGAQMAAVMEFKDPKTKAAPTTNLYLGATPREDLPSQGVMIPGLVKLGVQFAVCNAATHYIAGALAKSTKQDDAAVYKEITANLIPNAHLVAAGIIGVNRAQEYGYTLLTAV